MIYFISGHRDLTWEEFAKWYTPLINTIYHTDKDAKFVVADCEGCDSMAQDYLVAIGATRVVTYHIRNRTKYVANKSWTQTSEYTSDIERDTVMTKVSDCDIAFIREGREDSGTAQNILRRWTKN